MSSSEPKVNKIRGLKVANNKNSGVVTKSDNDQSIKTNNPMKSPGVDSSHNINVKLPAISIDKYTNVTSAKQIQHQQKISKDANSTKSRFESDGTKLVNDQQNYTSPNPDNNGQEKKKTILRVNLIKKSTRHQNLSVTLENRRLLKNKQKEHNDVNTSTNFESDKKSSQNVNNKIDENIEVDNKDLKKSVNKIGFNKNIETDKSINNNTMIDYKKAKESQKLVLSMIKDISRTLSKEDLDRMLTEIHYAIDEVRSVNFPDEIKINNTKIKKNTSVKNSKTINSTDSNKVTPTPDSNTSYKLKEIDSNINVDPNDGNVKNYEEKTVSKNQSQKIYTQNNIDQKMGNQFLELSSDDDVTIIAKDRKPNSSRLPDRCLRITSSHAKYISPHRKRSLEDRLTRAQEAREKFLEYRANKFREILKKVEEVRAWREEDILNLKASVQTKLQRAAEKRREQLDKIIRKAHDEDSKVSEIQFINNLELQNKRHDINSRKKEFEARLQDLQDERLRKIEEKQAKEVAAEERRKTLEAERKAKLLEIQQRRKIKDQKVEQQQQVKEKRRIEKNRDRDQKITAIKEAFNTGVQTLKDRINQKHEQSERRHEVNLRLIRQKAFELSIKRYNSFINESNEKRAKSTNYDTASNVNNIIGNSKEPQLPNDSNRLHLKPFNTKKFCNLCKETIASESALFSHLRSEKHHFSISEHYGNTMLTTNEAVEIHNLRHIVDTVEPLDCDGNSDDQQSSRASSLVNYYHSSIQLNGGIYMSENDRTSLLAIERRCRKLRHKLIVAGKPYNKEWFINKIRQHLVEILIQQRQARNQTTNTESASLANMIDLSANNTNCQQNKQYYLKINRIIRELISVTSDQRISGGGLMPPNIIHTVDRLLADLNKQLVNRQVPQLSQKLLHISYLDGGNHNQNKQYNSLDPNQLEMATKMIEFYAIDTLFLFDIVSSLISILRRIVPNVSLTSKLPSTVSNHCSTMIDPISMNSYYCHRMPTLHPRIYVRMISLVQYLCSNNSDLCYTMFQSNNLISLSDILSYRLGFIIGNESPASSISGSSSAATLSAHTLDNSKKQQHKNPYMTKNHDFLKPQVVQSKQKKAPSSSSGPGTGPTSSSKKKENRVKSNSNSNKKQHKKQQKQSREEDEEECCKPSDGDVCDDDYYNKDNDYDDADKNEDYEFCDRTETYKRTEEVVDDMTAGLCKLLATITETILSKPLVLVNQIDKAAFDQRSDDFIRFASF